MAGFDGKGLLLTHHHFVGLGVDELQTGRATDCFLAGVEDACRNLRLVTHADEARHVGLYHHVLLGHGLAANAAIEHLGGVGNAHKAPRGQTLGQRELQRHLAFLVSGQGGVAEGCLLQVLAQLHFLFSLLLFRCFVSHHGGLGIGSCHYYFFGFQHYLCHIVACYVECSDGTLLHDCCTLGQRTHAANVIQSLRYKIG